MKKLNSAQREKLESYQRDLESCKDRVDTAIGDFNLAINELWESTVGEDIKEYNTFVREAQEFIEEMRDKMHSYYDERSESWQEGDKGDEYQEWMDIWDSDLDEIGDGFEAEETSSPDFDAAEEIQKFTDEP